MSTINKIILATLLSFSTILAYAQTPATTPATPAPAPAAATDISGTYNCSGSDPFQNPPTYKENIVFKKTGSTYSVQMIHSDSVLPYLLGTGIVNPDLNNVISFVYWDPKNANTMGTELFQVNTDGTISGVYADHNKMKSGVESCTKATS